MIEGWDDWGRGLPPLKISFSGNRKTCSCPRGGGFGRFFDRDNALRLAERWTEAPPNLLVIWYYGSDLGLNLVSFPMGRFVHVVALILDFDNPEWSSLSRVSTSSFFAFFFSSTGNYWDVETRLQLHQRVAIIISCRRDGTPYRLRSSPNDCALVKIPSFLSFSDRRGLDVGIFFE